MAIRLPRDPAKIAGCTIHATEGGVWSQFAARECRAVGNFDDELAAPPGTESRDVESSGAARRTRVSARCLQVLVLSPIPEADSRASMASPEPLSPEPAPTGAPAEPAGTPLPPKGPAPPAVVGAPPHGGRRRWMFWTLGVVGLFVVLFEGVPWLRTALST